ncbi:MAG: RecQ family ATP-dependent DNA helicase [Bacteroidales bacterium]|nr:RecQ family ATP-dependent DNA helicase [Bacteroidales bacterium]
MTPREILKHYWNYDSFRPLQEEIISSVLQGTDTLALLPTGGGKSLCYQIPAMAKEGVCLVISPLIALMKDQVHLLQRLGIKASYLVSGMNRYQIELVLNNCIYNDTKLLYVSPERLKSRTFLDHLKQMNLSLIAVDEAHCISQWGFDFRPPYMEIGKIRAYHPHTPVLALTATATAVVLKDIQQSLQFKTGSRLFRKSFYRENLNYMVLFEPDKYRRLLKIIQKVGGSGIVYVRNRKMTVDIAQFLNNSGITAEPYHAGFGITERDAKQAAWTNSNNSVMVATNAFGMGIDKANVRFVIHLNLPESLEAYYQEAGRAGRDGKTAYAVLLYDEDDIDTLNKSQQQTFPELYTIRNVYKALCNTFRLPIGTGMGQSFDFDITGFSNNYGFRIMEVYSSLRLLEHEGLLALQESDDSSSLIFIPISKQEIYKIQVENRRYAAILNCIQRDYSGVYSEFVPVSEYSIARHMNTAVETIEPILQQMDKEGIISYKRRTTSPQIVFLAPRVNDKEIYLVEANYSTLKESSKRRINDIVAYVKNTQRCRSQQLSEYFDDMNSPECQVCDVCRQKRAKPVDPSVIDRKIRESLMQSPKNVKDLVDSIDGIDEKKIVERLRVALDYLDVTMNDSFVYTWTGD